VSKREGERERVLGASRLESWDNLVHIVANHAESGVARVLLYN
jgi:hypothetical protein